MSFYSIIRKILPSGIKGWLTRLLIYSRLKPAYNRSAKSPFEKGLIVFSADFEMAWAFRFSKTKEKEAVELGLDERENMPELLDLFNQYKVPVTWATVGHLFLDQCEKNHSGFTHSEMPRPDFFENKNWEYNSGDWYSRDPGTDYEKDPAWYAPDLVEKILASSTRHELGCHTFSHIDFSDKNCTKNIAEAELKKCIELAEKKGISLKSMVFPGGTFGNYECLTDNGFICYRKPGKYHLDLPTIDSFGLVVIPSSLSLEKDSYGWSKDFHLKVIRKFLEKTIKHKLVCHFWFHPSMDKWYLENVMPDILKMVSEFRDSDNLRTLTMGDLAEAFLMGSDNKKSSC